MSGVIEFRERLIEEIENNTKKYKNIYLYLIDFNQELVEYSVEITLFSVNVKMHKRGILIKEGGLEILPTDILIDIYYKTIAKPHVEK